MNASTKVDRISPDTNALYYGDCLEWMREWEDNCVDLIYLDPPFNSKTNYSMLFKGLDKDEAQFRAFCDTWTWGRAARYSFRPPRRATHHNAPLPDSVDKALNKAIMRAFIQTILTNPGAIEIELTPASRKKPNECAARVSGETSERKEKEK